jgi:hypothetical protein
MTGSSKIYLTILSACLVVGLGATLLSNKGPDGTPKFVPSIHQHLSPVTKVDALYPSMLGPSDTVLEMKLTEAEPELVWITGYRADMVDPEAAQLLPDELMCHNTLSFHSSVNVHSAVIGSGFHKTRRIFTLSQGQSKIEFPPGFGIPASSAEPFMLQSQVLNLREENIGTEVRHRVKTEFVADSKVEGEMVPLSLIDFGIALKVSDPQAGERPEDPLSCATDAGGQPTAHNSKGDDITSHWVVNPGPETRRTYLGKPFPEDSTIHYISIHMHPYAKSLELVDLTAKKSVYKALCRGTEDQAGLAEVDYYSSVEGLPVYKDHHYELVSHYDNTSDKPQTAMAFMFTYVKDIQFKKPNHESITQRTLEFCGSSSKAE